MQQFNKIDLRTNNNSPIPLYGLNRLPLRTKLLPMKLKFILPALLFVISSEMVYAQKYKEKTDQLIETTYKGHKFSSEKNIAENLDSLPGFSVFRELYSNEEILSLTGDSFMGTMFILSDAAFNDESDPDRSNLFASPENKIKLVKALIVPGRVDKHALIKAATRGGRADLATLGGDKLQVRVSGENIELFDTEGNVAVIVGTNFYHSNGFFHLAEGIIVPSSVKKSN